MSITIFELRTALQDFSNEAVYDISKELCARAITKLTMECMGIDSHREEAKSLIHKSFKDNILSKEDDISFIKVLKNGGTPKNFKESVAEIANKYATEESNKQYFEASKKINSLENTDRKEAIAALKSFFSSESISTEIVSEFDESIGMLFSIEADDIMEEIKSDIKEAVDEVSEKSEVTKKVITEFKEYKKSIKDEKEALVSEESDEIGVDCFTFAKQSYPVSAAKFKSMHEDGKFSLESIHSGLRTAINNFNGNGLDEFVSSAKDRLECVISDAQSIESYKEIGELAKKTKGDIDVCLKNMNDTNTAYTKLGFNIPRVEVIKDNSNTFNIVKRISDYSKMKDEEIKVMNNSTLMMGKCSIENDEQFFDNCINYASLKVDTNSPSDLQEKVLMELRESLLDYSMEKNKDGKDIVKNIDKPFKNGDVRDKRCVEKLLTKIKVSMNGDSITNKDNITKRLKSEIKDVYSTEKYDELVDSFFDETNKTFLSTENMYEVYLTLVAKNKMENNETISEESKEGIKQIAEAYTSYTGVLQKTGFVNKDYLQTIVKSVTL